MSGEDHPKYEAYVLNWRLALYFNFPGGDNFFFGFGLNLQWLREGLAERNGQRGLQSKEKVNARGAIMARDPDALLVIGETLSALDEMKGTLVTDRCLSLARSMYEAAGGSGLYEDQLPLGRIYRNIIAGRQHIGVQHRSFSRVLGATFLAPSPPGRCTKPSIDNEERGTYENLSEI